MEGVILNFRSNNTDMLKKWSMIFDEKHYRSIDISVGDFFDRDFISSNNFNGIIMPGNSFGISNEISDKYEKMFGKNLMNDIRTKIIEQYDGELVIGMSIIIPISGRMNIIYTPISGYDESVENSINCYLAFKAALKTINIYNDRSLPFVEKGDGRYNLITKVLCPPLCIRDILPVRIAYQMKFAYDAAQDKGAIYMVKGNKSNADRLRKFMTTVSDISNLSIDKLIIGQHIVDQTQ